MKTKIIAAATAAALTLGTVAPAAAQMTMRDGTNMLTGMVYNEFVTRGIPTDTVSDLSLAQLAQIQGILNSGESESQKTQRIEAIVAQMQ